MKAGSSYGETDELGEAAVVDRRHLRDLHATILHLMGLDHEKFALRSGLLPGKIHRINIPFGITRGAFDALGETAG